jgi:hypothetical protein
MTTSVQTKRRAPAPGAHHIDKRVDQVLAAEPGAVTDDDLISTVQLSRWLGVSVQWCETARSRGYGPPFVKLSAKAIRYRRGDVKA